MIRARNTKYDTNSLIYIFKMENKTNKNTHMRNKSKI